MIEWLFYEKLFTRYKFKFCPETYFDYVYLCVTKIKNLSNEVSSLILILTLLQQSEQE